MKVKPKYKSDRFHLYLGKSEELLKQMPSNSVHAIVCDPPYELGFMGKGWDRSGIANNVDMWREALRVLKPGGHLLAFSGSRTYHRMVCAIEDAGFEIRDQIMWLFGSGFPKSQNISKAIDKAAGAERKVVGTKKHPTSTNRTGSKSPYQAEDSPLTASFDITVPATKEAQEWDGWGTSLKPAHEPIVVARKPLAEKTIVKNVLKHRTGALNIDACRIEFQNDADKASAKPQGRVTSKNTSTGNGAAQPDAGRKCERVEFETVQGSGRFPANVIHDGSEEVLRGFPITQSGTGAVKRQSSKDREGNRGAAYGKESRADGTPTISYGDKGSAARFFHQVNTREGEASAERRYIEKGGTNFAMKPGQRRFDDGSAARFYYCAKASTKDRNEGLSCYFDLEFVLEQRLGKSWENAALPVRLRVDMERSLPKVIAGYGISSNNVGEWNTWLFGNITTDQYQKVIRSTIKTTINSTTKSEILSYLRHWIIKENIPDVSHRMESNISPVVNAESHSLSAVITNEKVAYRLGASNAVLPMRLKINVKDAKSDHPTVKPTELMRYLVRLVTPPNGIVLDPFMGSGSTGKACMLEGFKFAGIDMTPEYVEIAYARIRHAALLNKKDKK
jgi:site-specific DNA-methyltransferase (adenine-specific)